MSLSRPIQREPNKGSSQPLFLALFLLLLAFFILLNALSTVEEGRSNRVLESVKRAFPSALRAEIGADLLDGDPGQVIGDNLRAQIGEVFRDVLPVARVTVEPSGNPLFVEAPARRIYAPAAGGVTPTLEQLAGRLAPIVGNPPDGSVLEVQILYAADADSDAGARMDRIRMAAETVEAFVAAEIDPVVLSGGLESRPADVVRFVFRTRPTRDVGPRFDAGFAPGEG